MPLAEPSAWTEGPENAELDGLDPRAILALLHAEGKKVPAAVESCLNRIGRLVDAITGAFRRGGALILIGSGYSGRLGVLQADECRSSFATDPRRVRGLALSGRAPPPPCQADIEDGVLTGLRELESLNLSGRDVLIALEASGPSAPSVISAMQYARCRGATVATITCSADSPALSLARHPIALNLGPELVKGVSVKAGGALRLVLDLLTSAAMIGLGKVYRGLMVDPKPYENTMNGRASDLVMQAAGCDRASAEEALETAGRRPKLAILMLVLGIAKNEAEALLALKDGHLSLAIAAWHNTHSL